MTKPSKKPIKPFISLSDLDDDPQLPDSKKELLALGRMAEQVERSIGYSLQVYASKHGLTVLEAQALQAIYEMGHAAKLSTIADRIRVPMSTMTGISNRLQREGLVEKSRASDDARASVLRLTDAGSERAAAFFGEVYAEFGEVVESLGVDALYSITIGFQIVQKIAARMEAKARKRITEKER